MECGSVQDCSVNNHCSPVEFRLVLVYCCSLHLFKYIVSMDGISHWMGGYILCVIEGAWQLAYSTYIAPSLLHEEKAKVSFYP